MKDKDLSRAIQKAAIDKGISGVMELVKLCEPDLNYSVVRKVWNGDGSTLLSSYDFVAKKLGLKITFVSE